MGKSLPAFRLNSIPIITTCLLYFAFQVSALHYNQESISFSTLDELLSTGKELKVWSDTTVRILGISFSYRASSISWQYKANKSIPCTLSVGDTLILTIGATYIQNADTSKVDSIAIATGPGQFNYIKLQIATFPHSLVTTNTISGPSSDTAGKSLRFSHDSAYCTLHHKMLYTFDWGDGFRSPGSHSFTATHCWSVSHRYVYTVRVLTRCQENLFADTLRTFPVTIDPVAFNKIPGQYTSGFFIRSVGGKPSAVDFSQINTNPVQDSDIVFSRNYGYQFIARRGLISLGIFNMFPFLSEHNCGGASGDTTAACKVSKQTLDSLVESLHITCPSLMPDTIMQMDIGQICLIKTTENRYAILIKIGMYIGGIDREYYYWGYQRDGSRALFPDATTGLYDNPMRMKTCNEGSIKFVQQGNLIYPVLPRNMPQGQLVVFTCNGSLAFRHTISPSTAAFSKSFLLSKGVYVVSVKTVNGTFRQLLNVNKP
jgi:hypothetical protein